MIMQIRVTFKTIGGLVKLVILLARKRVLAKSANYAALMILPTSENHNILGAQFVARITIAAVEQCQMLKTIRLTVSATRPTSIKCTARVCTNKTIGVIVCAIGFYKLIVDHLATFAAIIIPR